MQIPYLTVAKYAAPILLVLGLGYCTYDAGRDRGKAVVQSKWDEQKKVDAAFVAAEKIKNAAKEAAHNTQDRKINDQLAQLKVDNAKAIADIRISADRRVQDSAKRESLYRAASEGSAAERASLASHAAELDGLLAESVGLLDEGRALIELRDGQIKQLAAQIENDRQLIAEAETIDEDSGTVQAQ